MILTPEVAKLLLELNALNEVFRSERTRLHSAIREELEEQRQIICSTADGAGDQNEALRAVDEILAVWDEGHQTDG